MQSLEDKIKPLEIVLALKKALRLKEVVQKALHQKIICHAAEERNLEVTPEEIQAEADRQRYELRLEKAADTLAWLQDQMIAPEEWEEGICDRLLSQKLAEHLFSKEVEKVFAENRLNFEQVLLYQIVVASETLAQELFYQLEESEISFYEAAHLYDLDEQRRQHCGYVGQVYRWQLNPELSSVVFGAQPQEVLGPIATDEGFHLLMVEKFIPAELTPQRYQELLDQLFQDWLTSELNYWLYHKVD